MENTQKNKKEDNVVVRIGKGVGETISNAGMIAAGVAGLGITIPILLIGQGCAERPGRVKPFFGEADLKFIEKQLEKTERAEYFKNQWIATFSDGILSHPPISNNSKYDLVRLNLLRNGVRIAESLSKNDVAQRYRNQIGELERNYSATSKWTNAGLVDLSLHEHLRTHHDMKGYLDHVLNRSSKFLGPMIIGVTDFENYGEDSRFNQLERQAIGGIKTENGLYFPAQDILFMKNQEVPTEQGHLLVIGLNRDQFVKSGKSLDYTIDQAKDFGALTCVDHPFSPHHGLGQFLMQNRSYLDRIDLWEIHNSEAAIFRGANKKANDMFYSEIKGKHKILPVTGTDGHSIYEIGKGAMYIGMPAYSGIASQDGMNNAIMRGIKTREYLYLDSEKNSYIGAIDHMVDLATIIGLSKLGIKL